MRSIQQLIDDAGGTGAVAELIGKTRWAVLKWPANGIPDRYWDLLIERTQATAEELLAANRAARGDGAAANDSGDAGEAA